MKTRIIAILTLCSAAFVSCSDFLDYDEVSQYEESQIFSNFGRTQQFVTNIYSYLRSDFCSVDGAMRASACDEAVHVWDNSSIHTFTNGTWGPRNTVDDVWGHYYSGIRAANFYLERGTGKLFEEYMYMDGYATQMRKYRNYEYEVKFLRAFFHFELIKRYGGVPIVDRMINSDNEANSMSRNSFHDCVDFIVDECDSVAKYLPISYDVNYDSETGRVPRAAAYALKSRVLLYAASELHNPKGNENYEKRWERAALAAQEVMDLAGEFKIKTLSLYELIPNNLNCQEVIWERREGKQGNFESKNYPIGFEGGNTGTCPTQNLVDAYGMKSGSYNPQDPYNKNRDPRLNHTIAVNNSAWVYGDKLECWEGGNSGYPKVGASPTGYYLKKYINKNVDFRPGGSTAFFHSWVLFRYGEILLNYAEAVNEVVGPNVKNSTFKKTAIETLNLIRRRTLILMPNIPSSTSDADKFRELVRNERFVELAFEDHRFWDIRRWKIGPQTTEIKGMQIIKDENGSFEYTPRVIENRVWDDKYYLYPISQSERSKNPNLEQNPGW